LPLPPPAVKSSPQKRWSHRSHETGMPKNPSQMPMKVAAYEMELGAKLCSSTPQWYQKPRGR
jgi:hypothetical protein